MTEYSKEKRRASHLRSRERNLETMRAYGLANKETLNAKAKERYRANKHKWQTPEVREANRLRSAQRRASLGKERLRELDQISYLANREKKISTAKAWQAKNREWKVAYDKRRHEENRPVMLEKARANYRKNRPKWQAYYQERKELFRKRTAEWRTANPEMVRAAENRRRARLLNGNSSGVSPSEWAAILEQFGNLCAYCRKPNGTKKLERDHVIPVSKGGLDEPDNVVPACRGCNGRKAARLDWRPLKVTKR